MPTCKYDLVLVRGAPGVGKSSLADSLKNVFPQGVSIESESIWKSLNIIDWLDEKQSVDAIISSLNVANDYLQRGYKPAVVVDVFYGDRINNAIDQVKKVTSSQSFCVITLLCENEELDRRIHSRLIGWTDLPTSMECNESIKSFRAENEIQINTTYLSPEEVQQETVKHLTTA
jgi:broad-specificity NMP kinase